MSGIFEKADTFEQMDQKIEVFGVYTGNSPISPLCHLKKKVPYGQSFSLVTLSIENDPIGSGLEVI